MNVSTKRASIGLASTMVAAGLVVGGVVSTSDAAAPPSKTVQIVSMFAGYSPAKITVKKGAKVTWHNEDSSQPHTVTSVPGVKTPAKINSGTIGPGRTFAFTFTKPGVYHYRCNFHHNMTGTVTVTS